MAASASRRWSAALVYHTSSARLACPVMAPISWAVQPASANRRAPVLGNPGGRAFLAALFFSILTFFASVDNEDARSIVSVRGYGAWPVGKWERQAATLPACAQL